MSLINRMLRDLSARQPESGDVMKGIQIGEAPAARPVRYGLLMLIALAAGIGAAVWYWLPKPPATTVAARAAPAPVAATPAPATPAPGPQAQADQPPAAASPAAAEAPVPAPAPAPARPATSRHRSPEPKVVPQHQHQAPAAVASPAQTAAQAPDSWQGSPPAESQAQMPGVSPAPGAAPAAAAAPPGPDETLGIHAARPRDQREAEVHLAEANAALHRGEPASAERELRTTLEIDPTLHLARDLLVGTLIDQGRLDEAQALLDEGLKQEPQRIAFRRLNARIELARGQPDLARQMLETSPPAVLADPEYHGLLAAAYQRLNRHEDAMREYAALVQAQPGEGHWWAGLGISRDVLGDVPGALAAYAQARKLGRLDPRLLEYVNRRIADLQRAE